MKQIVLIYGGLGLDRILIPSADGRRGIYISSGSYPDASKIQPRDTVLFFDTQVRRMYVFEYDATLAYTDAGNHYIELPSFATIT